MGAEKTVRHWVLERKEVWKLQQGRRHGETQAVPLSAMQRSQKTRSWKVGNKELNLRRRIPAEIIPTIAVVFLLISWFSCAKHNFYYNKDTT